MMLLLARPTTYHACILQCGPEYATAQQRSRALLYASLAVSPLSHAPLPSNLAACNPGDTCHNMFRALPLGIAGLLPRPLLSVLDLISGPRGRGQVPHPTDAMYNDFAGNASDNHQSPFKQAQQQIQPVTSALPGSRLPLDAAVRGCRRAGRWRWGFIYCL